MNERTVIHEQSILNLGSVIVDIYATDAHIEEQKAPEVMLKKSPGSFKKSIKKAQTTLENEGSLVDMKEYPKYNQIYFQKKLQHVPSVILPYSSVLGSQPSQPEREEAS
jgi:hypothetical protein